MCRSQFRFWGLRREHIHAGEVGLSYLLVASQKDSHILDVSHDTEPPTQCLAGAIVRSSNGDLAGSQ